MRFLLAGQVGGKQAVVGKPGALVQLDNHALVDGFEHAKHGLFGGDKGRSEVTNSHAGRVKRVQRVLEPSDRGLEKIVGNAGPVPLDEEGAHPVDGTEATLASNPVLPYVWDMRRPSSAREEMPSFR